MYETDDIVVWNLSPGGVARCGAVSIFNVVGALKRPVEIRQAHYSLNAEPENPVFF